MDELTPEQYQQILGNMARDEATERASLKLQVSELTVRLQAAMQEIEALRGEAAAEHSTEG